LALVLANDGVQHTDPGQRAHDRGVQDEQEQGGVLLADPAVLMILLKGQAGPGEGYDWVECGGCEAGWQVVHHAEGVG
jgi:hypothetical protein